MSRERRVWLREVQIAKAGLPGVPTARVPSLHFWSSVETAFMRAFKTKVLVFMKPPHQSSDHVKSKKRWDPTVDRFYFHHWFRTSNVFSNEYASQSSVSRCQERPWTRQSQPPWVRRGCGWHSCRPRPSHPPKFFRSASVVFCFTLGKNSLLFSLII